MNILEVKELTKNFGGIRAVDQCCFKIEEKKIYGLIGPNGSGKTTVFNIVTGLYDQDHGDIFFKGRNINKLKTHQRARLGIGRTFQLVRIFQGISVIDNMLIPPLKKGEREINARERALELLDFVNLTRLRNERAGNLSFGQQRLLELAIALMQDPELVLMDEPTSGVNPAIIQEIISYIKQLRDKGKTFIIVEHNIPAIMEICDWIIVLDHGRTIAEGTCNQIAADKTVIEAYLGGACQ